MKNWCLIWVAATLFSCKDSLKEPTAQEIIDRSIAACGGEAYTANDIAFRFRDMKYTASGPATHRVLTRTFYQDSAKIEDIKATNSFTRYVNDSVAVLSDSLANVYANAVNSVHYFAYLPYGLNDAAVHKKYLGKVRLDTTDYYKVEISFDQENGGDDFDDVYIYWFNSETYIPEYLAYEFHVNGGGQRFRKAFNGRVIGGIRFADYQNYKNAAVANPIQEIDKAYTSGSLELLSEIRLEEITVNPGNYN